MKDLIVFAQQNPEAVSTIIGAAIVLGKLAWNKWASEKLKAEVKSLLGDVKGYSTQTAEFKAKVKEIAAESKSFNTADVKAIAEQMKGADTNKKKIQRVARKLFWGFIR